MIPVVRHTVVALPPKIPTGSITITSPVDGQSLQSRQLVISGTYTVEEGTLSGIRARFNGGVWVTRSNPTGGTYSITINATTGTGTIEVQFARNSLVAASVQNIAYIAENTFDFSNFENSHYLALI